MKRRDFIITTGITGLGISVLSAAACNTSESKKEKNKLSNNFEFKQEALPYAYSDLEPYIDAQTMEIHYSKHHAGYVRKLNAAIENHSLKGKDMPSILAEINATEEDMAVLNNAGGHFNHSMFWNIMQPGGSKDPKGRLAKAIDKKFGGTDAMLNEFSKAAATVFGSGWAWLSLNNNNELFISATPNQENPLMKKVVSLPGTPIMGIDVWEHAYYLKYQNKRKEYISNFLKTLNWDVIESNFESLM